MVFFRLIRIHAENLIFALLPSNDHIDDSRRIDILPALAEAALTLYDETVGVVNNPVRIYTVLQRNAQNYFH